MILQEFLDKLIPLLTSILEFIGVAILVYGSVKAIIGLVRTRLDFDDEEVNIQLAQAMLLSLEFKLAAEILKTVTTRTIDELIILSIIVVIRVILTYVIHWEIRTMNEGRQSRDEGHDEEMSEILAEEELI